MLGGSSGLNFMAWDRASAQEYDAWEQARASFTVAFGLAEADAISCAAWCNGVELDHPFALLQEVGSR